jgi:hypothetical protein
LSKPSGGAAPGPPARPFWRDGVERRGPQHAPGFGVMGWSAGAPSTPGFGVMGWSGLPLLLLFLGGAAPGPQHARFGVMAWSGLPLLLLFLGGAAVYRCDNRRVFSVGFSR